SAGGVNVAAAVAINLAKTISSATLVGTRTIMAGGRFTLATSADTDAFADADGGAVQPADGTASSTSGVNIAAAVAINKADIVNEAILPANGTTIHALMASSHELGASAKSGAGGGKVSIAGSVAIDIENIRTTASLAGTLHAGTGNVSIVAASNSSSGVSAVPLFTTTTTPAADPFVVVSITDVGPSSSDLGDPNGATGGRVNGLAAVPGDNET